MSDMGINIVWFIGNHDIWLFDYLRDQIGMEVIDGNVVRDIDGKNFSWDMAMHYTATVAVFAYFAAFSATAYAKTVRRHTPALDYSVCTPMVKPQSRRQSHVTSRRPRPRKERFIIFAREYHAEHPDINFLSSATGILPLTTP